MQWRLGYRKAEKGWQHYFPFLPMGNKKEAQAFLAIARPSLDFIPSRLIEAP